MAKLEAVTNKKRRLRNKRHWNMCSTRRYYSTFSIFW